MPSKTWLHKNIILETFVSSENVRYIRILFSFLFVLFIVTKIVNYLNQFIIEGYNATTPTTKTNMQNSSNPIFQTDYLETNTPNTRAPTTNEKPNFDLNNTLLPGSPVWKETGTYRYSGTGYVPDYEESVYLNSQYHSQPEHLTNMPYLNGGFCAALSSTPLQLEDKCNSLENEVCASTDCCVLLGGQKCVKGNESGPYFKNNYSDFLVKNKDYYYYQGKCFGNCP